MDFIEVEITQWDKHQPRKDIKHPTWFALNNRILEDAKLFDLSDAEWKALLYIFCQASQQTSGKVRISITHAKRVCEIQEKTLRSTLDKLAYAGVTSTYAIRTDTLRDTTRQTDKTDKTDTATESPPTVLDFEKVYNEYPKKEGKAAGIKICKRDIKTKTDLESLLSAILRYREHHKAEGTEKKFLKHFSTFMGEWRDWLDPDHGAAENFAGAGSGLSQDKLKAILEGA